MPPRRPGRLPASSTTLAHPVANTLDSRCSAPSAGRRLGRECSFINTIGSDRSYPRRPEILASTGLDRGRFVTLIHPASCVSLRSRLGQDVAVNFGVSIGGRAVVGDHVSLSPGCIVGHDGPIEDYAILAPGAIVSGFVLVGRNSYVGAGASIRQQLRIGETRPHRYGSGRGAGGGAGRLRGR